MSVQSLGNRTVYSLQDFGANCYDCLGTFANNWLAVNESQWAFIDGFRFNTYTYETGFNGDNRRHEGIDAASSTATRELVSVDVSDMFENAALGQWLVPLTRECDEASGWCSARF